MRITDVKFDCKHFMGSIPCKPSKQLNLTCSNCTEYKKISKRILIIKLGALGDVIRTTPLFVKLKEIHTDAHFTWLTHSPDILPKNQIDSVYKLDAISLFTISNSSYDIAINLDKDLEACILLEKVNAKEKFGYIFKDGHIAAATPAAEHKLLTGFFDQLSKSNTKSYLEEIFEICDLQFNYEPYLINLNEKLAENWNQQMRHHAQGKKIIGLNTGCGPRWNTRLWSEDSWVELASELNMRGYFPVFMGGELEHEKNSRMSHDAKIFYPGHFSLEEFIALTNSCDLIVTQVSMMMHIATALKKQMVLMNNIFNRHEFELYGRGEIVEPTKQCECYYGNTCIYGSSCMQQLTPDTVLNAVSKLTCE
jgi:heptosyltransferase-2